MDTTKIIRKIKYGNVELKMKSTTLQTKTVVPSTEEQLVLPDIEYGGLESVTVNGVTSAVDENIIPANIRKGKSILGVEGILEPDRPDQNKTVIPTKQPQAVYADPGYELAEVIVEGVTSSVDENILATNIKKGVIILGVEGNLEPDKPDQSKVVSPSVEEQVVRADTGYELASVTVEGVTSDIDENIQADNIRYGVEILGVVGSMEQKEDLDAELTEQDALLDELDGKIDELPDKNIDLSQTTATAEDVLQGKKFYNAEGELVDGGYKDMLQRKVDVTKSCYGLFQTFPDEDMSWVKNLDTTGTRTMEQMFYECKNVISLDLSNFVTDDVITMSNMIGQCTNLEILTLSGFNTSKVTEFNGFCNGCSKLKTVIGTIDLISASNTSNMLPWNDKLETFMVKNIRKNLQLGLSTVIGSKLSNESLINAIQELWDLTDSTSQTLTLSTTSKNNIATIYVKLVDITEEMIANDPYIANKKPCVVCDASDEGAMTLTEYAISKNWAIA